MLIDSKINSTRLTRIAIDSRDRKISTNANANSYVITLDEAIHDVLTMTLLVADVPFVAYLVDSTNNHATMTLSDGSSGVATIPTGDYSGDDLAIAVGAALAAQFPDSSTTVIKVVYSALTDNIQVTCSMGFSLTFDTLGSVARELGFAPGRTYTAVLVDELDNPQYILIPPFRRDHHANPSIILSIQNASVNTATNNNQLLNSAVNQSFAILTPSRSLLCNSTQELPFKNFNPPIARLHSLTIDFKNYDGSLVDFQNHEHRLELLITSIRSAKYLPQDAYQ